MSDFTIGVAVFWLLIGVVFFPDSLGSRAAKAVKAYQAEMQR